MIIVLVVVVVVVVVVKLLAYNTSYKTILSLIDKESSRNVADLFAYLSPPLLLSIYYYLYYYEFTIAFTLIILIIISRALFID